MGETKTILDNKVLQCIAQSLTVGKKADSFMADSMMMSWLHARYALKQPVPEHNKVAEPGAVVTHFKYLLDTGSEERKKNPNMYQYVVLGTTYDTETGEEMVIYRALYGDFKLWCRSKKMFLSEVDHEKYPECSQKYRFEFA